MKSLIVLVVGLLAVGCETPLPQRPKSNSVKQLTLEEKKALRDSVAGTYERFDLTPSGGKYSMRYVFLENGAVQSYYNNDLEGEMTWKIVDKEVHVKAGDVVVVYRLELVVDENATAYSYLTPFAAIGGDGKRISITEDRHRPKLNNGGNRKEEEKATYKKIK